MKRSSLFISSFKKHFKNPFLWVRVFLYCCVLLVINIGISKLMQYTDGNNISGESASRNPNIYGDYDVIFIGDSRSHTGLNPKTFNRVYKERTGKQVSSINLSRPGLQAPYTYYMIENFLAHSPHPPKVIIMNISFYLLSSTKWLKEIYMPYFYLEPHQIYDAYKMDLFNIINLAFNYPITRIPMFRHLIRMRVDSNLFFKSDPKEFWSNIVAMTRVRKEQFDPNILGFNELERTHIKPSDVIDVGFKIGMEKGYNEAYIYRQYYRRLFELARKHNIQIIIYEYPWPEQRNLPEFHDILAYYQTFIQEISEDLPNISRSKYDCFWPVKYFRDPLHLNPDGADKLTRQAVEWYIHRIGY